MSQPFLSLTSGGKPVLVNVNLVGYVTANVNGSNVKLFVSGFANPQSSVSVDENLTQVIDIFNRRGVT